MKLFGRPKKAPDVRTSINNLRDTLDLLEKREEHLQKKIERELAIAKQNASKNKRVAMMALKRKKTYEGQLSKLSGARMTIEQQLMAIEGAQVSLQAMNAMRMGASAMRSIHGEMSLDQVDNTMDEIREQMDIANEINDAISQPLGDPIDEDDLEAELLELESENLDEQLLGLNAKPQTVTASPSLAMPAAPTASPSGKLTTAAPAVPVTTPDEDAELRELEASMAFS